MAVEVKLTFSREEVEAAWQEASGQSVPLPDASWRKFVLNARSHVDVTALLSVSGVLEGGGGGGGGGPAVIAASRVTCELARLCDKEGCCDTHIVRGALASAALSAHGLAWCDSHRLWHADDAGVFCLTKESWEPLPRIEASRIKAAGYAARELLKLFPAGKVLADFGYELPELRAGGCTVERAVHEILPQMRDSYDRERGASKLESAGYTVAELRSGGFTLSEIISADYGVDAMVAAGFTIAELIEGGCSGRKMKDAGVALAVLKAAGFSSTEARKGGFEDGELVAAGWSEAVLEAERAAEAEREAQGSLRGIRRRDRYGE